MIVRTSSEITNFRLSGIMYSSPVSAALKDAVDKMNMFFWKNRKYYALSKSYNKKPKRRVKKIQIKNQIQTQKKRKGKIK